MQTIASDELNILKTRIIEKFHPAKIILFGSQARGLADSKSDIDICVLFSHDINKRATSIQILSLAKDLKTGIDCIVTSKQEFQKTSDKKYTIFYQINQTGKTIYEAE